MTERYKTIMEPGKYGESIPKTRRVKLTQQNLHFIIIINPNTEHSVIWFKTDEKVTKEYVFDAFKKIAKAAGDWLMICDGQLYQYDHGNAKWVKSRWEDVQFEV